MQEVVDRISEGDNAGEALSKLTSIAKGIKLKRENPALSESLFIKNFMCKKHNIPHWNAGYALESILIAVRVVGGDEVRSMANTSYSFDDFIDYCNSFK